MSDYDNEYVEESMRRMQESLDQVKKIHAAVGRDLDRKKKSRKGPPAEIIRQEADLNSLFERTFLSLDQAEVHQLQDLADDFKSRQLCRELCDYLAACCTYWQHMHDLRPASWPEVVAVDEFSGSELANALSVTALWAQSSGSPTYKRFVCSLHAGVIAVASVRLINNSKE